MEAIVKTYPFYSEEKTGKYVLWEERGGVEIRGDEISKINLIYCVYVPKQAIPMDILTEEEKETVEDTRIELAKTQILRMLRPYTNSKNLDHYMGVFMRSYGLEDTKEMRKILKKEMKEISKPQRLHRPKDVFRHDEMEL
jgi:hypothetical protein